LKVSQSSRTTYKSLFNKFSTFAEQYGLPSLPTNSPTVERFLASLAVKKEARSAANYVSAIRYTHYLHGFEDPLGPSVDPLAVAAKRFSSDAHAYNRRAPLTREALSFLAQAASISGLPASVDLRTVKPLLILSVVLCLRASEICNLRRDDVVFDRDTMTVLIRKSKTDPFANGFQHLIRQSTDPLLCPVRWCREFVESSGNRSPEAPLFVTLHQRPFTSALLSKVVQAVATAAGLSGRFSSHSVRIGGITQAIGNGSSDRQTMTTARIASTATLSVYARAVPHP
jgi:integrase